MEDIVQDMKSYTSGRLKKAIAGYYGEGRREWMMWIMERAGKKNGNNRSSQFRQQHNKPIEIRDSERFYQKLNYIHGNPLEAGFVARAEDWLYSSAGDFY